ncbi:divalent metal cation transporter [Alkalimonas collagenimarina]|uniref:Divalent metal cation transporter n=1 Tax=Alkalimonas collagenimarina TaxID=400390 RepID=A0ABT9GZ16_9GAMM|nr:divalent metal cation transporter [Alkalimonas collagenimarina]MDP4535930.1 divalent metal cation transporter [Alkalimonas collagenimarina]
MLSTLKSKLATLGPGLLMATAAIGGSHLVASTQAGALFGWQLIWLILLVNILKYPFFRFGVQYTLDNQQSLLQGYQQKGRGYFYSFIVLNLIAAVVNTAGVLLLTASLLHYALPWQVSVTLLCWLILAVCLMILLLGHYKALDAAAKIIMLLLTITTVFAVIIAASNGATAPVDYAGPSPWQLAMLGFLVALMGWMPAPIEISAISSLWLKAKLRQQPISRQQGLFDFNLGYWVTVSLALVFVSLGALVQYGSDQPIALAGAAFAQQLIGMYSATIGDWTRPLVALIAFLCMFGTTLTVLDGYARSLNESFRLLGWQSSNNRISQPCWLVAQALCGMAVILFFRSALGPMLTFAMTLAFLTTPVFAWLNFSLMRNNPTRPLKPLLVWWSWLGLAYLVGFAVLFLLWYSKLLQ